MDKLALLPIPIELVVYSSTVFTMDAPAIMAGHPTVVYFFQAVVILCKEDAKFQPIYAFFVANLPTFGVLINCAASKLTNIRMDKVKIYFN